MQMKSQYLTGVQRRATEQRICLLGLMRCLLRVPLQNAPENRLHGPTPHSPSSEVNA